MPHSVKMLLGTLFFAVYGPLMIYIYAVPHEIVTLGIGGPFRKVFALDRNFDPTIFTLGMGILFTMCALIGAYKFVSSSGDS